MKYGTSNTQVGGQCHINAQKNSWDWNEAGTGMKDPEAWFFVEQDNSKEEAAVCS